MPNGSMAYGRPAKVVRDLTEIEILTNQGTAEWYVAEAQKHTGVKLGDTSELNCRKLTSNEKIENMLKTTCWIIDVLPNRVDKAGASQYLDLEKKLLHSEELVKKHCNILLKLNCYYKFNMLDYEGRELGEADLKLLTEYVGHKPVYLLFEDSLISVDPDDMHMSLYNPSYTVLTKVKQIAESEGMFLWKSGR